MMSEKTFEKLTALLDQNQARYRVVEHSSAGKSEDVAKIRGTQIGQGAKALVCTLKGNGMKQTILAVLPAEVSVLTDCVFGAIPPFSFHENLLLIADPSLLQRYDELAFNAGTLECSVILNTADYARIAQPRLVEFIRKD